MMRDINQMEGKSVFPARRAAIVFSVGIPIYFVSIILIANVLTPGSTYKQNAVLLLAALGLALTLLQFVWLARLSRYTARSLSYRHPGLFAAAIVVLFFAACISYPLLQRGLNDLLERRSREMSAAG
jgi:hypothetical protein